MTATKTKPRRRRRPDLTVHLPSWLDEIRDPKLYEAAISALASRHSAKRQGGDRHETGRVAFAKADLLLLEIAAGVHEGEVARRKARRAIGLYDDAAMDAYVDTPAFRQKLSEAAKGPATRLEEVARKYGVTLPAVRTPRRRRSSG